MRGGIRLSGALDPDSRNLDESRSYVLGPTAEIRARNWALEGSVLFQRFGDRSGDCAFTFCSFSRRRANAWQVPLVAKRYLTSGPVAPFLGVGYSFRRIARADTQDESYRTGPMVPNEVVDYSIHRGDGHSPAESTHGVVAAAGIEFRFHGWRIAPEFRYTHWNPRFWEFNGPRGYFTGSNPNQYDIHLTIRHTLP